MSQLKLLIVIGTAREGRQSEKVAVWAKSEAEARDYQVSLIDVRDCLFGQTKAGIIDSPWAQAIADCQAILIVSPEYNHGYPGELKILLDSLYGEYAGKVVGICGVSTGVAGGARMTIALQSVLIELGMKVVSHPVLIGSVSHAFSDEGKLLKEEYQKKVSDLFDRMEKMVS